MDIQSRNEIELLVNKFYDTVRSNNLLGPIFDQVIEDRWETHLDKMYTFWETVLLGKNSYSGYPFAPHIKLPIQKEHFVMWVKLFESTVKKHFEGPVAEDAVWRAHKMAKIFQSKLDYFQKTETGH